MFPQVKCSNFNGLCFHEILIIIISWNWNPLFLDEAPDTGDDSDEDLVTNYLNNGPAGSGTNGGTDNLVPSIHITPQSPNGNHVLGMNY